MSNATTIQIPADFDYQPCRACGEPIDPLYLGDEELIMVDGCPVCAWCASAEHRDTLAVVIERSQLFPHDMPDDEARRARIYRRVMNKWLAIERAGQRRPVDVAAALRIVRFPAGRTPARWAEAIA